MAITRVLFKRCTVVHGLHVSRHTDPEVCAGDCPELPRLQRGQSVAAAVWAGTHVPAAVSQKYSLCKGRGGGAGST
jgi:hypothetical protein